MAHFTCSFILIGCMLGHVTQVAAYMDNGAGLTSFPTDILPGETEIILKNNLLTVITSIGVYPNLETLDLSSNSLNTFPDCANITWLKNLYLNSNQLTVIPYALLDHLTELKVLKLRSNLLTSFPNPPGPGGTLTTLNLDYNSGLEEIPDLSQVGMALENLYISGCGISSVPVTKVAPLQNLTTIFIHSSFLTEMPDFRPVADTLRTVYLAINQIERVDDNVLNQLPYLQTLNLAVNPLESLPNPCKRGSAYHSNYTLSLTNTNPLVCDRRARWLLAAQRSGMTVDLSMPCLSPQHLAGTPLQDVAWEDFYIPNGTMRDNLFLDVTSQYSCHPLAVEAEFEERSLIACATHCAVRKDCTMFAYGKSGGSPNVCAITGESDGTIEEYQSYISWYALDL